MTALSPTMEEGTIIKWNKQEGDSIAAGDVICEVETDKAAMDYEATQEGILLQILRAAGKDAQVGDPIGIIGEKGEDIAALIEAGQKASAAAATAAPPAAATAPTAAVSAESVGPSVQPPVQPTTAVANGRPKASPLARKLAEINNIDLSSLQGSGPGGRIIKRDIEGATAEAPPAVAAAAISVSAPAGADQTIPVSATRATIAKRLAESKFSAPHYYLKLGVDMRAIMAGRTALNRTAATKVSLNAFLIKLVAETLRRHPALNSSWQGDTILQFGSIDIGLAVATERGLIAPVVRNCAHRGVVDIDSDLAGLIDKARRGALKPNDYSGATFTVSNLGSSGIEEFSAIINPPGAAILALGQTRKTAVVDDEDKIVIRPIMKMTLSCDHRVVDGATAAAFLSELKQMMEDPIRAIY